MTKFKLTAMATLSVVALAGCATPPKDVGAIQQKLAHAEAGNGGQCMMAIHKTGVAIEKANSLLAYSKDGMLGFSKYDSAMAAADNAVKYRGVADEQCNQHLKELLATMVVKSEKVQSVYAQIQYLPGVTFAVGSDMLTTESKTILEAVAGRLVQEHRPVEVAGHTSNTGSADFNMALSQQRAETVREFMISKGVEADMIIARGYGMTQPVATNDTKAGQTANQRVEIRYLR